MSKTAACFILLIVLISLGSCRKNCGADFPLSAELSGFVFKQGSYFVYNDSVDHIIDSQYVYQYTFARGSVQLNQIECGTYTTDALSMAVLSFRNGSVYDTLNTSVGSGVLHMSDSQYLISFNLGQSYYGRDVEFIPDTGSMTVTDLSVGSTVYPIAYLASPCMVYDSIPTSIYMVPNYGIVKRVEHRPTGDVSWNLIRYHIVQ